MAILKRSGSWTRLFARNLKTITRNTLRAGALAAPRPGRPAAAPRRTPALAGDWTSGVAPGATGLRRYRLYQPPGMQRGERLPLLVMLHGCGQDAEGFARATRMNRIAARERFLVLYPEQDRLANAQGCWNWFDTRSGRARLEAASILGAVDQVCRLQPVDRGRLAVAGMSAGASMAALLVTLQPARFQAVVMHSGIPPGTANTGLSALVAMHGHRATQPLAATPATMAASWPPLLVIHGTADAVVAARNGQAAALAWANAAGAQAGKPRRIQRGKRYPMTLTDYQRRDGSTVATLAEVDGLGHAWSGGASGQAFCDSRGPDASRMVWAFAARQFQAEPVDLEAL